MAGLLEPAPRFSVDLEAGARDHVSFLREVHAAGLSLRSPTAEEFRRYERVWLPLVGGLHREGRLGAAGEPPLCPPLDVAWLWHCHRLAPASYARCCRELLGAQGSLDCPAGAFLGALPRHLGDSEGDPEAGSPPAASAAALATRALWEERFPEEPFFAAPSAPPSATGVQWHAGAHASAGGGRGFGLLSGFDVIESAERQSGFLWQVSQPRFRDPAFLADAAANYGRFLLLMKLHPSEFVVPTYQIDLMWHTHILASARAYREDCCRATGLPRAPDHDDSVNDRSSPETKLNVQTDRTKALWAEAFGAPFSVPGGLG